MLSFFFFLFFFFFFFFLQILNELCSFLDMLLTKPQQNKQKKKNNNNNNNNNKYVVMQNKIKPIFTNSNVRMFCLISSVTSSSWCLQSPSQLLFKLSQPYGLLPYGSSLPFNTNRSSCSTWMERQNILHIISKLNTSTISLRTQNSINILRKQTNTSKHVK